MAHDRAGGTEEGVVVHQGHAAGHEVERASEGKGLTILGLLSGDPVSPYLFDLACERDVLNAGAELHPADPIELVRHDAAHLPAGLANQVARLYECSSAVFERPEQSSGNLWHLSYHEPPVPAVAFVRVPHECCNVLESAADLEHGSDIVAAEHVTPKRGCATADKRTEPVVACRQVGLRNEVQRQARFVRRFCKLAGIGKPVFRVVEERYDLTTFPVVRWQYACTGKPTNILFLVYQGARAELLENRCN